MSEHATENPFVLTGSQLALAKLHAFANRPSHNVLDQALRRAAHVGWMTGYYATHEFGRSHPLRTTARLWAWQLWRRTAKRQVRVELARGATIDCPPWSKMAGAWVAVGLHEPREMLFVLRTLVPGDGFIDVGANLGVYSALALRSGAKVLAFEPTERARAALLHNLSLNAEPSRWQVEPVALSDHESTMSFRTDLESSNHLVREGSSGDANLVTVPVKTLDSMLPADFVPSLIKVDAEGFDAEVLRGAKATLERHRPAVIAEIWAGGGGVRAALEPLGYGFYRYDARSNSLVEMPRDFRGEGYLVAVHRDRLIELEQKLARPFELGRQFRPEVRWLGASA